MERQPKSLKMGNSLKPHRLTKKAKGFLRRVSLSFLLSLFTLVRGFIYRGLLMLPPFRAYRVGIVLVAIAAVGIALFMLILALEPSGNSSNLMAEVVGILIGSTFTVVLVNRTIEFSRAREKRLDALFHLRCRLVDICAQLLWASGDYAARSHDDWPSEGSYTDEQHQFIYFVHNRLKLFGNEWSNRLDYGSAPESLLNLSPRLRVLLVAVDFESRDCAANAKELLRNFIQEDLTEIHKQILPELMPNVARLRKLQAEVAILAVRWIRIGDSELQKYPTELAVYTVDKLFNDAYIPILRRERPVSWRSREPRPSLEDLF